MLTLPNTLSFLRVPLAFIFLQVNPFYRLLALFLAMLSDYFDGFLARRYKMSSAIGTTLDPLTDKFFVFFVLSIFYKEQALSFMEASCLMCRDFAVILFGFYLMVTKQWKNYEFRAIWCGKITTALQFIVLLNLVLKGQIAHEIYFIFIFLGIFALFELYFARPLKKTNFS